MESSVPFPPQCQQSVTKAQVSESRADRHCSGGWHRLLWFLFASSVSSQTPELFPQLLRRLQEPGDWVGGVGVGHVITLQARRPRTHGAPEPADLPDVRRWDPRDSGLSEAKQVQSASREGGPCELGVRRAKFASG